MPTRALKQFLRMESSGGILLMIAAGVALLFANLPGFDSLYQGFIQLPIEFRLGSLELKKNVLLLVNDGLMAIFFLLVALEIKREVLEGELSNFGQVVLPGIGAVGGIAIPALLYVFCNMGNEVALRGWAIPAATDIAFSLGILSLLGPRVPLSLKILLTAVAVVDDLAAIVIIALFYTVKLSFTALLLAVVSIVILFVLNRLRVRSIAAYILVGIFLWFCVLKSGVHATLAGVALGFAIPMRIDRESPSPLKMLEHKLHPWVAFAILPLFAFANSGVSFDGIPRSIFTSSVTVGIAIALLIGKTIGVFVASWIAIRSGIARLPKGITMSNLLGVAILTGIGFTMSLFIGTLAFEGAGESYAAATRIGVFGGSIASAFLGYFVLKFSLPEKPESSDSIDDDSKA